MLSKFKAFIFLLFTLYFILFTSTAQAIVDPLAVPNNKYGIHIIQATPDESSPAASLVNSTGGDWGYITVLIEGKDKDKGKWQEFFNDLRRRHLIPLVRLATIPNPGGFWQVPDQGEASVWADFLDSLNWPTKNRYVIIYNEPNHGAEWGQRVDAKSYARVLNQTIDALKKKNPDFFVLNAGLDASTPNQPPNYLDEVSFLQQMNEEVSGIFNKLDGWVSHSYPNPGFVSSPNAIGKGTVRTWVWELQQLRSLGLNKELPIFIAETGWKHAEGVNYDPSLPSQETLSDYYQNAFSNAWNSSRIVAVTPFLLSYQEPPFDHFSFKKIKENSYYSFFDAIKNMPKNAGKPIQENKGKLTKGEIYSSIVAGENYEITLTFKNVGQSIWGDPSPDGLGQVKLVAIEGGKQLGIEPVGITAGTKVEPEKEYSFKVKLKAPDKGSFKVRLNLFNGSKEFDSQALEFTTEVKLPVILQILTELKWKNSAAGDYVLRVTGAAGDSEQKIVIDAEGKSSEIEARYLLPDYEFEFTLERPYYKPKTIKQTVKPGVNTLEFEELQPALFQSLLNPKEFWKLLPWSN